MRCQTIGTLSLLLGLCATVHAETIIHAGRLINGRDDKVHEVMSLVIDQGRIVAVREGYVDPTSDDQLFDLRECTVMPGWMDMHTHLMSEHYKKVYSDKFFMNEADFVLRSTVSSHYV